MAGLGGQLRGLGVVIGAAFLAACSIMPTNGPANYDVKSQRAYEPDSLRYAVVRVTPEAEGIIAEFNPRISGTWPDRRIPKELKFGIGDIVGVSIFESSSGGLFIPPEASVRPGNFIALPNQPVNTKGYISVPYAGRQILAKDKTPDEVQAEIVDALKDRAIDPQAVVTLVEQRTSLISVLGDVNTPARFPASAAGERILDAITRAGGPKSQGFDTWVMLERRGRRETVPFGALVYDPSNNVYVHPNDTIYLYREPQTFVAFGAVGGLTGAQGQYNFDAWRVSLAEAVAKANGLTQALADPASVFLYRGETRAVAEQLGVDCSRFEGPIIPIIYNVNLRDPAAYFLATAFQMRNKDVLYVSNGTTVEIAKVLDFLRLITATVNDPIIAATNVYVLKNVASGATSAATFNVSPPVR